jgi:signal transduction histidine kinase
MSTLALSDAVMSIRTKLLLVITALLGLSVLLSFVLHRAESERIRDELHRVVNSVFDNLKGERTADAGGSEPPVAQGPLEIGGRELVFGPTDDGLRVRLLRSGREGLTLLLETSAYPGASFDELHDLEALEPTSVLPARSVDRVRMELQDPIDAARRRSLPREVVISGAVLLVGLALTWLVAGRLSRPLRELRGKMEAVAGGDLDRVELPRAEAPGRDELRQMDAAFRAMVEGLREKRDLETKVFQTERLAALGNLAAGVAHDIRNPLNTIGLTLAHLREKYLPSDPALRSGFLRHLDDLKGELERLNALVRSFLSLAHPDRAEKHPCRLRELVEETLSLFRKEAESKGVEVVADLDDVGPLLLSPAQVRRAFTNVLVNALQALAPSGGRVVVGLWRTSPLRGDGDAVPSIAEGGEAVLSVADDGPGISPEHLDKVFLPYFTTRSEGTGLGLPIAKGAVEANGGRIELRRGFRGDGSRGTTVEIAFPLPMPDPGRALAPVPADPEGHD